MSEETEVYVRIGGEALDFMQEWMERRQEIHERRVAFGEEVGSDALYLVDNGRYVTGWVGEADEPHLTTGETVFHKGKTCKVVRPDKRYKEGKRLAARMKELRMPSHGEVLDVAGIPHHYILGRHMRTPGFVEIEGHWYATGVHACKLDESKLCEGCEVLKAWEFLKLKDEASEGEAA